MKVTVGMVYYEIGDEKKSKEEKLYDRSKKVEIIFPKEMPLTENRKSQDSD